MYAPIENVEVRAFTVPTDHPESDGTHQWDATTLVLVKLSADGRNGIGYTYSHSAAGHLIATKFRDRIVEHDALAVDSLIVELREKARNLGHRGLVGQAISAVDAAAWDLKARLLGLSLVDLLGPTRDSVPIYGSGGFTSYSIEQLCDQLAGWTSQGIRQVKMKVGRDPRQDQDRVKRARDAIGPQADLFVDANGAYAAKEALNKAEQFAEYGVLWFEEPVSSDDLEGLHYLREHSPAKMDITAGEYGDGPIYFRRMLQARAVDVLMADATRCGGFTGFLRTAALCDAFMVPLSAHTAPNLHAHACCALNNVRHIEYFHDHVRLEQMFFEGALTPRDGALQPDRSRPGLGLELRENDVKTFEISISR